MTAGQRARLVSVGSVIVDIRVEAPHLPERGGDVLASSATVNAGGGFNILAAAARQGMPALFAGRHGGGPNGARIRAAMVDEHIATFYPEEPDGDSGFCLVIVEPDGERTFITSPGVESRIGRRDLSDVPVLDGDTVFVSGYDLSYPELGAEIVKWLGTLPPRITVVLDPGPLAADIPQVMLDAVLSRVGILTLNRREAHLLTGADETIEVMRRLGQRVPSDCLLVLRAGAGGCDISGPHIAEPCVHVPAVKVRSVDTTGAGDTHTGVLIAALADGLDPVAATARANAAAAWSVTRPGPATAPHRHELDRFIAETSTRSNVTAAIA